MIVFYKFINFKINIILKYTYIIMKVLTIQTYDPLEYEPIELVSAFHIVTLSTLRRTFGSLAMVFGANKDWTGTDNKFEELRNETTKNLIKVAKKCDANIILGTHFNISEIGSKESMLVCHAYGTAMKKINISKSGNKSSTRTNKSTRNNKLTRKNKSTRKK
jgi:uncharacterized protein YbjQ (UPF0145 family)